MIFFAPEEYKQKMNAGTTENITLARFDVIEDSPNSFHFYLSDIVDAEAKYIGLLNVLRRADEHTTIHIHINSPGGYVNTGIQIINAIRNCKGLVVGHLEGICYSMATFIFLNCHDFVVNPDCLFMIHSYSGGTFGEGHKMLSHVNAVHEWILDMSERTYSPFLTDEELDQVMNGKDFWFKSEEVMSRLDRVLEAWKDEEDAEQHDMYLKTIDAARKLVNEYDEKKQNDLSNSKGSSESTEEQQTVSRS